MIRYAITDGFPQPGICARWAAAGVDFVQLRNKEAEAGALAGMARAMLKELRGSATKLLVNGRVDVAMAVGAAGIHLTAHPEELTPRQVRVLMPGAVVSVSCHGVDDVSCARENGADIVLFGPVFEKRIAGKIVVAGTGLALLRAACAAGGTTPVLALGGVTAEDTVECLAAGAAGVAGIRLFASS